MNKQPDKPVVPETGSVDVERFANNLARLMEQGGKALAASKVRLEKEFPNYAALSSPKPSKVEDIQKLLGNYEALVFLLTGEEESYVFAVTADRFDWRTIPAGRDAIASKVAAFRRGLELDAMKEFDLGLANELFTLLIGPVDSLIKDKGHLLVAPSGVLTALPFHLLVTEKPATSSPQTAGSSRRRPWRRKKQRSPVRVLPSARMPTSSPVRRCRSATGPTCSSRTRR